MTALFRKLLRDLLRMRGQAVTIAIVVACGIGSFVTLRSAYRSLLGARDTYYESSRFGDVFAQAKRAPESVAARIEAVPGVAVVETRLVEPVMIPIEGLAEPATGRLVTLPANGNPRLNAPYIRKGRMVEPGRPDEALILETFATAHHLEPGAKVPVVINGVLRQIHVVGVALSPEYVIAVSGAQGFAPDHLRFAVLWMDRDVVAAAFDLKGSFDDVSVRLQPGARSAEVRDRIDAILKPYGGYGAVDRSRQPSSFFVDSELLQLESYATIAPAIFLGVAAFLVNVVLSRLVHLQRPQIATLKALGYNDREIAVHYLSIVLVVVAAGSLLGVALGAWLGRGMLGLYQRYYHFPRFDYRLDADVVGVGVSVSVVAAMLGGLTVVWRAVRLPAAEAMKPDAPPTYRRSLLERMGITRLLGGSALMVLREMTRRPLRTLLSCTGIAFGVAVVVVGFYTRGALDVIVDLQFEQAQREDLTVSFVRPVDGRVSRELAQLPGVLRVESERVVPVRVRKGPRFRETTITGLSRDADLRRIVEWPRRIVEVPEEGVLLSAALARVLDVGVGDSVVVEVLEGDRRSREVRVAALANEMFGLGVYMSLPSLQGLLGGAPAVSVALLTVDARSEPQLDARLKRLPVVAGVARRREIIAQFERQSAESMNVTSVILTIFGCVIAVAVVYNNARIALSMRGRDLASLRVLGFTRQEISSVLLGELGAHVALALVPGMYLGKLLASTMMSATDQETYRMPAVVTPDVYALAVGVTIAAAVASAFVVRRQLDHLDLVGVLKARE
ncbi:MAG: ABC transporter permease [Polyangiaceae bacterium]|nr:ABC transporter permease [Polyangiaceae bacterium]